MTETIYVEIPQEAQEGTQEATGGQEATDPLESTSEGSEEQETFTREYVTELREQAAEGRVKGQRFDSLAQRYVEIAASSILQEPSDLQWSDDYLGEDGLPDSQKITAAAEALAFKRPALAKIRGSVGQGIHTAQDDSNVSFLEMLRG